MSTLAVPAGLRRSVLFYRVMAYITGTLLIVLTVGVVWKYTSTSTAANTLVGIVGFAHGWLFIVYIGSIVNLGIRARLEWVRIVLVALCGIVPVFTFVAERSTMRLFAQPVH